MKKIFAILALTAFMASCTDNGGAGDQKGDTTTAAPTEAAPVDTSSVSADTTTKSTDTTATKTDSTKK